MSAFTKFECEVVRILVAPHLGAETLRTLLEEAEPVSYTHTGVGYLRTVRHSALPTERIVCRAPLLVGTCGDVECGFVVFLEGGVLTIECHTWDGSPLPRDFRKRPVRIEGAR